MSVDNRATRAHIAASRGYRHDHLSTDELLADEIADALMRDVAGKPEQFDTGMPHGPAPEWRSGRGTPAIVADRRMARQVAAEARWRETVARDPWGSDPDRTTRHWRPETAA
jgi:hypothetical protein